MSETLNLVTLDETGFARLYEDRIKPCFDTHEPERLKAVAAFKQRMWMGGAASLVLAIILLFSVDDAGFGLFLGAIGVFISFIWASSKTDSVRAKVKQGACDAIAQSIGVSYTMNAFAPSARERFQALGLLPACDRSKYEDQFRGNFLGAAFELYEGHLERRHRDSKGRTSWVTVFRGQCVRLSFPRRFLGVTIVRRDAGVFNMFGGGSNLKRVSLEDPVFEKAFEVYSDDQVESRFLLHPMFMQRLVELEAALRGKRLRCGFEQGDLLIAIEGGNLFEPGSMFKPLADPERARVIVKDVAGVLRVMDAVLTAQTLRD